MKRTAVLLPTLIIALAAIALSLPTTGCRTRGVDPITGVQTNVFDPVKTEQVKAAVTPIASSAVRRIILNSPQHSDAIANYFRAFGSVFCQMSATSQFDPGYLIGAADQATLPFQANVPAEAIDAKNGVIALYKIIYANRFNAELSPEKWPKNAADVICASIDQGLKDAGKPGAL